MLAKVLSSSVMGVEAYVVEVEVDIAPGLPSFSTVGLPDQAVKESRDRVKAALLNTGFDFPSKRITINLAPADIKKEGSLFDLPIALGILAAIGIIKEEILREYIILGELSLDGAVKPVKGVLPMALAARTAGLCGLVLPEGNAGEAAIVSEVEVFGIRSLPQAVEFLNGNIDLSSHKVNLDEVFLASRQYHVDFADVRGQQHAKRAVEVSTAGGHNILMIGPPGSGKTMLAKRIATILPEMTLEEAIETTKIYSIAGQMNSQSLIATRPFRYPHHTVSDIALIGGGKFPKPGEVSLAHHGVLFLDEIPEFRRHVLEVMRQPLEDGQVTISRAMLSTTFPARFMLAAAMNPCPCGFRGHPVKECTCTPLSIRNYISRVSGPLLDRIDLHIEVPAVKYQELSQAYEGERSEAIRQRVLKARQLQQQRFAGQKIFCNAHMQARDIRKYCHIDQQSQRLLETAVARMGFSARAYDRILKVGRTIADLAGAADIKLEHISEAIQYRCLDKTGV